MSGHPDPKPEKKEKKPFKPLKRTAIKKVIKPTGEASVFHQIWQDREHVSFISGLPLDHLEGQDLWYSIFAHVLAKGQNKYPKFKLYPKNIQMITPYEHHIFDNGTVEDEQEYYITMYRKHGIFVDWNKLRALAEELKQEYKSLPRRVHQ